MLFMQMSQSACTMKFSAALTARQGACSARMSIAFVQTRVTTGPQLPHGFVTGCYELSGPQCVPRSPQRLTCGQTGETHGQARPGEHRLRPRMAYILDQLQIGRAYY